MEQAGETHETFRYADGAPAPAPFPPPQPPSRAPASVRRYRDPGRLGRALEVCLAGCVITAGVGLGLGITEYRLVGRLERSPLSLTVEHLRSAEDRSMVIFGISFLVWAVTAAFFIAWTRRLYRNLQPLGVVGLRFGEAWAVGSWFVPFLNLVRPKQVIDDIWRASGPLEPPAWSWQANRVPGLLHGWWAAVIVAWIVGLGATGVAEDLGEVRAAVTREIGRSVAAAIAAVLALHVVHALTTRQRELAAVRLGDSSTAPPRRPGRRSVLLAVMAIAAAGVTFIAFDDGVPAADDGVLTIDLEVGDCFDYPLAFDQLAGQQDILSVDRRSCEEDHDAEIIAAFEHPGGPDASFPGVDAVLDHGLVECFARFEALVGIAFADSVLDIVVIGPSDSGLSGDRDILCVGQRLDGRPLGASVIGAGI